MEKNLKGRGDFNFYLKVTRPRNTLYRTVSHKSAFSTSYHLRVPNNFKDRSFASVAGTAFDYLARFMVAHLSLRNKDATTKLKAEEGIKVFQEDMQNEIKKQYNKKIINIKKYINNKELSYCTIVADCCYLARLEHGARTSWIPNENTIKHMKQEDLEVIYEVQKMGEVFKESFIDTKMVRENSFIIYNPTFGVCGEKLKTTDADIFIDGVLWDFKTTKSSLPKPEDETQLWSYYIYHMVSKLSNDQTASLFNYDVKAIAFYKARFGEIEYLKLSEVKPGLIYAVAKTTIDTLVNLNSVESIDEAYEITKKRVSLTK